MQCYHYMHYIATSPEITVVYTFTGKFVPLHIIKCIHLTSNVSLMTLHVTLVVLKSCKMQMGNHKYKVANSGSRAIYTYA